MLLDKEKIINSIADGYVDIKAYKNIDGKRVMTYHDTGDNTVTSWMREVLASMLAGFPYSNKGTNYTENYTETDDGTMYMTSAPKENNGSETSTITYHSDSVNLDGYCLNNKQYIYDDKFTDPLLNASETYKLFPSKILLGTMLEYSSWDALSDDEENMGTERYNQIIEQFGGTSSATTNFKNLLAKDHYNGCITFNDYKEDQSTADSSYDSSMKEKIIGPIKTLYNGQNNGILNTFISSDGKLIKPELRGAGFPCFIYFSRGDETYNYGTKETNDISCEDTTLIGKYNIHNKVKITVKMPSQTASDGTLGVYYPFNGYTIRQIGLFNDAVLDEVSVSASEDYQKYGTLLAIKQIQDYTKTADQEMEFSWTLTL